MSEFTKVRDYRHALRDLNTQIGHVLTAAGVKASGEIGNSLHEAARNVSEAGDSTTCKHTHPSQVVQAAKLHVASAHYTEAIEHLAVASAQIEGGSTTAHLTVVATDLLGQAKALADAGEHFATNRDAALYKREADSEGIEEDQKETAPAALYGGHGFFH